MEVRIDNNLWKCPVQCPWLSCCQEMRGSYAGEEGHSLLFKSLCIVNSCSQGSPHHSCSLEMHRPYAGETGPASLTSCDIVHCFQRVRPPPLSIRT